MAKTKGKKKPLLAGRLAGWKCVHVKWWRRNWIGALLIGLALFGMLLAILLSLKPCQKKTSPSELEVVFAVDTSGSFIDQYGRACQSTAAFIRQLQAAHNGELLVAFTTWDDGRHIFVPPPGDDIKPTSDIEGALETILSEPRIGGMGGGTYVSLALNDCLLLFGNSDRVDSTKVCVIFTDAAGMGGYASEKAELESKGIMLVVGYIGGCSSSGLSAGATLFSVGGMQLSSCNPSATSTVHPDTWEDCPNPTTCTNGPPYPIGVYTGLPITGVAIIAKARCCPYWLEVGNSYDGIADKAKELAEQISGLADSDSICVSGLGFLWTLLLFLPFLLYCFYKPLHLLSKRALATAAAVPPPGSATNEPNKPKVAKKKETKKKKEKGRWSTVETRHYIIPGTSGGAAPMHVNYGDTDKIPLPPSALRMKRFHKKKKGALFNEFAGVKVKDFYGKNADEGGLEEGDIDDYVMRFCCFIFNLRKLCCWCCPKRRGESSENKDDTLGTYVPPGASDIEMGTSDGNETKMRTKSPLAGGRKPGKKKVPPKKTQKKKAPAKKAKKTQKKKVPPKKTKKKPPPPPKRAQKKKAPYQGSSPI